MADTLWTVTGTKPVAWQLPLWAIEQGEVIELFAAVPLLNVQKVALHERMTDAGAVHGAGFYRIKEFNLRRIARPHPPGVQPEDMVIWGPPRKVHRYPERMERNEFLDALSLTGIGSRAQCEFWFKSIANLMLDWLVNQDRTVDFYFLRLHPTHMSYDWFDRITQRKGHGSLGGRPTPMREKIVRGSGLGFHRNYRRRRIKECLRRVEIEMAPMWAKLVRKVERRRFFMLKRTGYAAIVEKLLRSQVDLWARLHAVHENASIALPAKFMPCPPEGSKIIVPANDGKPKTRHLRKAATARRYQDGVLTIPQLESVISKRVEIINQLREIVALGKRIGYQFGNISKALRVVREVRSLRPILQDVRHTRDLVDRAAFEKCPTLRMLVYGAPGQLVRERLLANRTRQRIRKRRIRLAKRLKLLCS